MGLFLSFVAEHWVLCSIFIVLLLALIINEFLISMKGSQNLSSTEVLHLMNHKEAVVIDVRAPQAFSEGHILGSLNIPIEAMAKKGGLLEKFKTQNLIVVCAAGQSSQKVVAELKMKGFQISGLAGGILAWRNAGLPLSKH